MRLKPKVINLDPGQERTEDMESHYPFDLDVRDLISVQDVMEELEFGPNGALVFCMEHLVKNLDFLEDGLDEIGGSDSEYFIFDCPGQIELYTHIPVLRSIVKALQSYNITVCVVHVIDALFIDDTSKYISGALLSLISMMQLHAPAINVITKCDIKKKAKMGGRHRRVPGSSLNLISQYAPFKNNTKSSPADILDFLEDQEKNDAQCDVGNDIFTAEDMVNSFIDNHTGVSENAVDLETEFLNVDDPEFFNPDILTLRSAVAEQNISEQFKGLSDSICTVLDDYNIVSFLPLDVTEEDSIELIVMHLDNATQYGEDLEPRDPGLDEAEVEES